MPKPIVPLERRPLVSLNIDVANLPREAIERLVEVAPEQGRVIVSHAFGDFRREDMEDLSVALYQYGFRLIHCPAWPNQRGRLKSVVDDVMAQDMRDQMEYFPSLEVFILGTGDRNFIAVANALKRHGKKVVVAADQESINRELRLCADEYIQLPRSRGVRVWRPLTPEVESEVPSGSELLEQLRRLAESNEYLTLRRIVRGLLPGDYQGAEKARSALSENVQKLIEAGQMRVDRRMIKGRVLNTLVLEDGDYLGELADEQLPVEEPRPAPRRRIRRRTTGGASA